MLEEWYKICVLFGATFDMLGINYALEKCKISILPLTLCKIAKSKIMNSLRGSNLQQSVQWWHIIWRPVGITHACSMLLEISADALESRLINLI